MGLSVSKTDYAAPQVNTTNAAPEMDITTLVNLVSGMETTAYALVRSSEAAAANALFYAVAELEKIKARQQPNAPRSLKLTAASLT